MRISYGLDAAAKKEGKDVEVAWDSSEAVNAHALFCGMTGSGKTYFLKRVVRQMEATSRVPPRFHVFDCHGDILIEGASSVMFSEQTPYGLNPLRINADPHFGGVRKRIQGFIGTMNRVMTRLGTKQENALRNVLKDVYERHGFYQDDPGSWRIDESMARPVSDGSDNRLYLDVPMGEKDQFKELIQAGRMGGGWDSELRSWWIPADQYNKGGAVTRWPPKMLARSHPSIADVLRYARHTMQQSFLGTGMVAITKLEIANRAAAAFQKKRLEALRRGVQGADDEGMQEEVDKAKVNAVDAFAEYASAIATGRELGDVMKYDSTDVLKSVVGRVENLDAIGIFKPTPPPHDPRARVWRYDIRALDPVMERKLFVLFKLEELFAQAVERGDTHGEIVDVAIVDEAAAYIDDDEGNIINVIAREARKFGLVLICASQSPTHFPEDFMAAVSTKVILGIDEGYWKGSVSKMGLTIEQLASVQLKRQILVQIKTANATKTAWRQTLTAA